MNNEKEEYKAKIRSHMRRCDNEVLCNETVQLKDCAVFLCVKPIVCANGLFCRLLQSTLHQLQY